MAGMPDLMSMFRGGPPQGAPNAEKPNAGAPPQPQPIAGAVQNNGGNGTPQNDRSAINPDGSKVDQNLGADGKPKSPLAEFADFWKNEAPKEGAPTTPNWDDASSVLPKVNLDPAKLHQSAQRIDFAKAMPREKVTAALKGDENAFNEVMNAAFHYAYAQTAMSTTKIVEAMLGQMAPKMFEALPHHIRKHVVNDTVNSSDPIFQDPAVAPMLEMMKDQFRVKYPNASAKEIADKAQAFVKSFATAVNKDGGNKQLPNSGGKQKQAKEEDFSDFLNFS
jgi:hypothetical protein